MHRITPLTFFILLCGQNINSSTLSNSFRFYVQHLASVYHSDWRQTFLQTNPHARNRFKPTQARLSYNPSDFIYPMILTVGSCLVHRNLKVARSRSNASLVYVDILNMEYAELPSDWASENRHTARLACRYVLRGLRGKRLFNQNYIEQISEIIHIQWMKRNEQTSAKELLVPYANLTEIEKDKDRKAVLLACLVFNDLFLYHRFNTTPVHFSGYITQLSGRFLT